MALVDTNTFKSSADLSLWFKVTSGDPLNLADIPEIIPLRWVYFRDNWAQIRNRVLNLSDSAYDADYFRFVINDLTDFIARQRQDSTDVNPFATNKVYYRFYPVFDSILLDNISLTNEERTIIQNKRLAVTGFSKVDFLRIKNTIREYRDVIADSVGLSDPDYNLIYGRAPIPAQNSPTMVDINLLSTLEKELKSVDFVLANLFAVDTAIDPFALAKQNANNPDIDIRQYGSGNLVKLNFNEDLASLSKRYFGNPDRWIDIALANGLKEPYIDEIGEQLYLIANGNESRINIGSVDLTGNPNSPKFFINQNVLIQSDVIRFPSQRRITNIKEIPITGEIVLTLSGDVNLGNYLLADNASIRIFKPNTVNSTQYILLPSPEPLPSNRTDELPWFMFSKDADEKNTKIDIGLGPNGELLKNSTGDIGLSYGLENAIQAIKAKMSTELGANARHPGFGLVNLVGVPTSIAEDAKALLVQSITTQIQADARFDRVESLNISRSTTTSGVAYEVSLTVKLAGSTTSLPITFTVTT